MATREDVINEAKSWLNTPYHHMGNVKGAGVDCGQFLIEVFHAVGLCPKIDTGHYSHDWHFNRSEERYLSWVEKYAKPTTTPNLGDIALFKFGRCISHGGIITEWPTMIHSHIGRGVVYVNANDAELNGRLVGFYTVFED
jgi:cell wall-associated NlpC family hydrolase